MGNKTTFQVILWAANVVVWGGVYIVDRNLKSERKRLADQPPGTVLVDLSGGTPIQLAYEKKMIPEFTIYHV